MVALPGCRSGMCLVWVTHEARPWDLVQRVEGAAGLYSLFVSIVLAVCMGVLRPSLLLPMDRDEVDELLLNLCVLVHKLPCVSSLHMHVQPFTFLFISNLEQDVNPVC
jgi:hypothetical protein